MGDKRKILAACALVAAIAFLCFSRQEPPVGSGEKDRIKQPGKRFEMDGANPEQGNEGKRTLVKRPAVNRLPGRSKGELAREVCRIFGQAEAARARKLAERIDDGNGSYLYVVEPPSKGEVQTVKSHIADLKIELSPEEREDFEKRLDEEIDSYDPYGEKGRKVFLITVPVDGAGRMSGMVLNAGDTDELQQKFISGEPYTMSVRKGWFASYDGKTLDRFDQLLVWQPE